MRRALIKTREIRQAAIVASTVLFIAGVFSCTLRISRLSTTTPAAGGSAFQEVLLEHGRIVLETQTSPALSAPLSPAMNWQIDFGFNISYEERLTNLPVAGGLITTHSRAIPIAAPSFLAMVVLMLLVLPLRRVVENGNCLSCGYNLQGLSTRTCPECGETSSQSASRPRRSLVLTPCLTTGHTAHAQEQADTLTLSNTCRLKASLCLVGGLCLLGAGVYAAVILPVVTVSFFLLGSTCVLSGPFILLGIRLLNWNPRIIVDRRDGTVTYIGPFKNQTAWAVPIKKARLKVGSLTYRTETVSVLAIVPCAADGSTVNDHPFMVMSGRRGKVSREAKNWAERLGVTSNEDRSEFFHSWLK